MIVHIANHGPISWTIIPSQFQFDGKLVSAKLHYKVPQRYDNLHMPWQDNYRAMCKISLRQLNYNLDESMINFPSNLNYDGKIGVIPFPWLGIFIWRDIR